MRGLSAFMFFTLTATAWTWWCGDTQPCTCPSDADTCICRPCPTGYTCNFDNGYCYPRNAPSFTPYKDPSDCKADEIYDRGVCW